MHMQCCANSAAFVRGAACGSGIPLLRTPTGGIACATEAGSKKRRKIAHSPRKRYRSNLCACNVHNTNTNNNSNNDSNNLQAPLAAAPAAAVSRRHLLHSALYSFPAAFLLPSEPPSTSLFDGSLFSVTPPTLNAVSLSETLTTFLSCDVLLLGVHHSSLSEHVLQSRLLQALLSSSVPQSLSRPLVLGLECIETKYQSALTSFSSNALSEDALYTAVDWDRRWGWPYERVLPLLRSAKALGIPLKALGPPSEVVARARLPGGLANLSGAELRGAIGDAAAFVRLSAEPAFRAYVDECVTPSYSAHARLGLLGEVSGFGSFYVARTLRQEAIASECARFVKKIKRENGEKKSKKPLLVCVLGAEHVKFKYGVPARIQAQMLGDGGCSVKSVLVNPAPADAFEAETASLKIALQGTNVPIADFLWFTSQPEQPRKFRKRPGDNLPPVEQIVRPEAIVEAT